MNEAITAQIGILARQLRLPTFARIEDSIRQMNPQSSFEELLLALMLREQEQRRENRARHPLRQALFPWTRTLEELELDRYGGRITRAFLNELGSCEFIREHRNLVLIGNPGRGKTHLAIGVGLRSCAAGMSVHFATAAALCTQLREAREQLTLGRLHEKLRRVDLLILDELGYVRFDRLQCELLFRVVADRCERGSIIVTTNQAFASWDELFDNEALATAMVDRLVYGSITLDLSGTSYRYEHTRSRLQAASPSPGADQKG